MQISSYSDYHIKSIDPVDYFNKLLKFNNISNPDSLLAQEELLYWRTIRAAESKLTKTTIYAVLDKNDEICGQIHGMPAQIILNGKIIDITWPVNLFLSPELRGKGLGKKLVLSLVNNVPNTICIGGTPATLSLSRSLGWPIRDTINAYIKVLNPFIYFLRDRAVLRNRIYRTLRSLPTFIKHTFHLIKPNNAFSFYEVKEFTQEMVELIYNGSPRNSVITLKSKERIRWLCEKIPIKGYYYFIIKAENKTIGYMILRLKRRNSGIIEGKILDIFCLELSSKIFAEMLNFAVKFFFSKGVHSINMMASHPNLKRACDRTGFIRLDGPALIYWSPLPFNADELDWHITQLDSDYSYR